MNTLHLRDRAEGFKVAGRDIKHLLQFHDPIRVEHWRAGKLLDVYNTHNDITNEDKNLIFGVMFASQTQIPQSNWFIGLISLTGYSALAAADVMNSHAGWTEFSTYSGGARPAWGPGTPAAQSITNATPITFSITAGGTVKGVFVTSDTTLNGTVGKLWATALFTADVPVTIGDQLKATYTVSA